MHELESATPELVVQAGGAENYEARWFEMRVCLFEILQGRDYGLGGVDGDAGVGCVNGDGDGKEDGFCALETFS